MRVVRIAGSVATLSLLAGIVGCSSSSGPEAGPGPGEGAAPAAVVEFVKGGGDPLRILLTNDDGWDAPGITAVYDVLTEAGHDVRLVGPMDNNSGVSGAIDFTGELDVQHPTGDPNVYAVSTTPAGTVIFGVEQVFGGDRPDLVISGTNVGSNTGFDTNFSGTVGAAVVGSGFYGIPSIAVSTATKRGEEGSAAYPQTAELLRQMIEQGLPKLNEGAILNINYPVLEDGQDGARGVRYAPTAAVSAAKFGYTQLDDVTFEIVPGRADHAPAAGTDMALLADGYATVTLLHTDRSIPEADVASVAELVAAME